SPCDDGLTGLAHVRGCFAADPNFDELQGTIEVPVFQRGQPPYADDGAGGDIPLDAMGRPSVQRTDSVCVTLTLPKGATMPAAGWPVVLYAHDTGGSYRSGVSEGLAGDLANVTGSSPGHVAMLGYEGVMHGARRHDDRTPPEVLFFNLQNP